ncbi:unnamed protein product [Merluccius merluccius]
MGQLTSKSGDTELNSVPGLRFTPHEDTPPPHNSHLTAHGQNVSNLQIPGSGGDSDSRQEVRRSSIYSAMDLVPQLDFYANSLSAGHCRPTLKSLRRPTPFDVSFNLPLSKVIPDMIETEGPEPPAAERAPVRFGWIVGVTVRCMLNIWGVILFLRLSWITSQAGILLTCTIILMSVVITSITALSVSAIATNGRVNSGGAYFMISRTLGPEMGGPIGMVFSFANALACALNTVGFAEVISGLLKEFGLSMVDETNDVRIVGVITVTVLLLISLAGMEWESKAQILFFIILIISFTNYFVGTFIPPNTDKQSKGIFGYNSEVFISNLKPDWRGKDNDFFRMFSIFFPSAIGILSGVNISGDLKDPATAIPKGTLTAIFCTTLTYLGICITIGSVVVRDASGNITDALLGNSTEGCIGPACQLGWNFTDCIQANNCQFGLANEIKVLGQVSGYFYLITAGVFAASLSSALGFLVSAPKVFQCLCRDNIYPYIGFFAKGYGKNDEPLRAYLLCYFIAIAFILIAELDRIAALISNFFLCSYALINFSCFHASITNSPGWRPSFHYYSKWTALFGATISVVLMFAFTWWAALVTFSIIFFLFGYVAYNKPQVNWGTSLQASRYNIALSYSVALSRIEDHVKNFRPQCLVLTGAPNQRPALVDFVGSFTKHISLMICGDILMEPERQSLVSADTHSMAKWFNKRKVRSFYTPFSSNSLRDGTRQLMQAAGLGKMKPNTLVLGFKTSWREGSPEGLVDYVNTIYDTFDSNYCLILLRMMDGLDVSDHFEGEILQIWNQCFSVIENINSIADVAAETMSLPQVKTAFQNDQGKKTIDVYWIADDGGLTLLVPYLLTRRKNWGQSQVRVFIIGNEHNMEEGREEMISLLKRFRLDFHDVIVMTDSERMPQPKNLKRFEDIVAPYRLNEEQQDSASESELKTLCPWKISDTEMEALSTKSATKVRLNEIIRRNSQYAALVLVSLPVPQTDCPMALYMAWLDVLTSGLHCPVVLIRGNQQNVLTFYCQ